ncbi:MoxR-like ATPase [Mycoplasmoides fastidiosum]|uniref:MoxR-like ATPase n=1 Tax=Mycoplasmoides fastidiosum TaxID=92758 RepID=A0ABU0LYC6_9BACT|nr:AAA family ATPase [Mycoplasmoides fastidiosum]MDQ0513600.1 MoxR-like ATPase [Mycoplasmoides fastidiosum]UUD37977.1 AAA family ATPase [Mycoplasmoides fastidiosum]
MKYLLKNKINKLANAIGTELIERDLVIRLSILAIFAKESVFLLGPPGIGKSLISRKISSIFNNVKEFSVLMNKFTLTDEIFGPIDINKLKEGNFSRKMKGYLPDANVAFLDEIWKASSSIQNTLLTILNEKLFVNDGKLLHVNLYFVIAASNELPERNQSLEALWDRFLIKFNVGSISDPQKFLAMVTDSRNLLNTKIIRPEEKLDFSLIDAIEKEAKNVVIPQKILDLILEIKAEIEKRNLEVLRQNPFSDGFDQYYVSDRKWKKIINILKVSAYLNERLEVDVTDFDVLPLMLWNTLEQLSFYEKLVNRYIYEYKYKQIYDKRVNELKDLRQELIRLITHATVSEAIVIEAHTNPKGVEYYAFVDDRKQVYYFLKSEIDAIPTKARFSIDWLISYVSEEQFTEGLEPTAKLLFKYENSHFYLYEDNDETKPTVQIYTNFITKQQTSYEIIPLNDAKRQIWKSLTAKFIGSINDQASRITTRFSENSSQYNIFWDHNTKLANEKLAATARDNLLGLAQKVRNLTADLAKLKYGFSVTSTESLCPLDLSLTDDLTKPVTSHEN